MSALATALPSFELGPDAEPSGVSAASNVVLKRWAEARAHYCSTISGEPIHRKFANLAATWKEEVGYTSSLSDLVLSPSYQRIIGLGPRVVPSILVALYREPDHWFWALNALTGVDPVPTSAAGDLAAMTKAWLHWGEEQGLLD